MYTSELIKHNRFCLTTLIFVQVQVQVQVQVNTKNFPNIAQTKV